MLIALATLTIAGLALLRPDALECARTADCPVPLDALWSLGALGGLLGGNTRALYALHVDVREFECYRRTGKHYSSYGSRTRTASGRPIPHDIAHHRSCT